MYISQDVGKGNDIHLSINPMYVNTAVLFISECQGKYRSRGPEVKRLCDLFWWAELTFGQEPVFLEESVFKLFPEKLFSNY